MKPNIKFSDDASKYRGYETNMQFLSPVGHVTREYEILDTVTNKIFSALENRNWNVPGITVEFGLYGRGEEMYQVVRSIEGDDFLIYFLRVIGRLGERWNNTAGCYKIVIPQYELSYHEDLSGSLTYYTGKNWRRDRKRFKHGTKVNSKLHKKQKWYVRYGLTNTHPSTKGMDYTSFGELPKFFVANNDLGREYDPQGREPKFFPVQEVYKRIAGWLTEHVLEKINTIPSSPVYIDPFLNQDNQKPIPMPKIDLPVFYTGIDMGHIVEKLKKSTSLTPFHTGRGLRVLPWGARGNDESVPDVANDSFIWAGTAKGDVVNTMDDIEVGRWYSPFERDFGSATYREQPVVLKPKVANNVYIFDAALADIRREEIIAALGDRTRLTDEEVDDFQRASARTLVPITEYQGGFIQPVMVINRYLTLDEIELLPKRVYTRHGELQLV